MQMQTMAACGSLEHIFEKPLPENPTLLESLSPWKHIKSMNTIDDSAFTEIFGELHFKESHVHAPHESSSSSSPSSSLSSSTVWPDANPGIAIGIDIDIPRRDSNGISVHQGRNKNPTPSYYSSGQKQQYHSDSFSSMNSESLSLCTEGLGFESCDDVEDLLRHDVCDNGSQNQEKLKTSTRNNSHTKSHHGSESKKSGTSRGLFPPPISSIGNGGKPWVCFKSYREDGRFILKEVRIPTQEFLHACREDGRLKLQFIQSDDELLDDDDEDEDEENIEEQNDGNGIDNDDCKPENHRNGQEEENGEGIEETT
ncbi:uncharacterized protein LOC105170026 [Sesamum indicum]|uniref:Uncharacterized protein LOC105170026 n=1 Tax=Sesamum indicum TaxID=4182 RepID=A0A8M8V0W8_SESIN|nr:uncharacterized protein LOC105170026 [Sesamum indicum]